MWEGARGKARKPWAGVLGVDGGRRRTSNVRSARHRTAEPEYPRFTMKVITWNMGCGPRQSRYHKHHDEAWSYLLDELPRFTLGLV